MADGTDMALATSGDCTIVAKPHPFRSDTVCAPVKAGQTLLQMLGEGASQALEVRVGGEVVPRVLWAKVKPKAGQYVHATVFPQGGDGGKWLRTILLVVVAIVAWYAAPYVAGALGVTSAAGVAAVGAALGIIGNMLVTPLIPPPEAKP